MLGRFSKRNGDCLTLFQLLRDWMGQRASRDRRCVGGIVKFSRQDISSMDFSTDQGSSELTSVMHSQDAA